MKKASLFFISLFALFLTLNIQKSFAYTVYGKNDATYSTTSLPFYGNAGTISLSATSDLMDNWNNLNGSGGGDPWHNSSGYWYYVSNQGDYYLTLTLSNTNVPNNTDFYISVATYWSDTRYYKFSRNSSGQFQAGWLSEQTPPNYNTRIISVSPENNVDIVPFTQSSTTKYAPFDIDLLEYYNNISTSTIAYITTILTNKDIPAFTYTNTLLDIATGTATTSYTIYDQVPFGLYDYTIRLFDSNLDVIDSTTTTNIQFGSTTLPSITFEDIYGATTTQVYTATEQSVISYINLINLLKTKAPFGYFYIVRDSLSNINTNGTSTVIIVIPEHLKNYFFSPFDIAFSGILWFYFIVFFYKRLKHITI